MATAEELGLRRGDIVRVAIPVLGYEQCHDICGEPRYMTDVHQKEEHLRNEQYPDTCGEPRSRRIYEDTDTNGGPRVGVINHDVRFDPRYGRAGPHTRVVYLDPSPTNGKVAGDVVDLGPGYAGFIPPVERGDSPTE